MTTQQDIVANAIAKSMEAPVLTQTFNTAAEKSTDHNVYAILGPDGLAKRYATNHAMAVIMKNEHPMVYFDTREKKTVEDFLDQAARYVRPVVLLMNVGAEHAAESNAILKAFEGKATAIFIESTEKARDLNNMLQNIPFTAVTVPSRGPQKPIGLGGG